MTKEITKALKEGKLVLGTRAVLKGLKKGAFQKVFCATNCPGDTKRDLEHYSKASKIAIESFDGNSARLGELCGKPFSVLVVGIKK